MKTITKEELRSIPPLQKTVIRDAERLRKLERKMADGQSLTAESAWVYYTAIEEIKTELEVNEKFLNVLKGAAKAWIDTLPEKNFAQKNTKKILAYRYADSYDWAVIAEIMGISIRRLHQYEADAVKKIDA
jgi:DNA-directed RNA polymerase specialized sigma subunit